MKNELALPPYNKYSNINEELKKEINFKLYKSWTMKNIASPLYQNFIISLIKFDFFSVYIRISKRCRDENLDEIFRQMMLLYLLTDINRAKFLLEEFSNNEVIEEYLIYCPNTESIKICLNLLIETFRFVFEETSKDKNDTFAICFLDTYIVLIDANLSQVAIEAIRHLFLNMLDIGGYKFKEYLKRKKYDNWIRSFYVNEKKVPKTIINSDIFPVIKSDHCILSEKNNNNLELLEKDSDLYAQQFLKNLGDANANTNLIRKLGNTFLD